MKIQEIEKYSFINKLPLIYYNKFKDIFIKMIVLE
jgi:hypothetical protein